MRTSTEVLRMGEVCKRMEHRSCIEDEHLPIFHLVNLSKNYLLRETSPFDQEFSVLDDCSK